MKIAIADDNREILRQVDVLLHEYLEHRGISVELSEFSTPQAFIDSLEGEHYDLVVMDIYFDGETLTGVDAIKALRAKDRRTNVFFLTTSSDHMPEAFQVHAFSYIMKDQLETMLPQTMDDLMSVITIQRSITLTSGKQNVILPIDEIVSIETDGHYLVFTDINREVRRFRMTFSEIKDKLEHAKEFLLVNKGILVNMDHIKSFENKNVLLTNGEQLPARVRGYAAIVRQWHDYNFDKLRGGSL